MNFHNPDWPDVPAEFSGTAGLGRTLWPDLPVDAAGSGAARVCRARITIADLSRKWLIQILNRWPTYRARFLLTTINSQCYKVLQACFYKPKNTGLFLKSFVATSVVMLVCIFSYTRLVTSHEARLCFHRALLHWKVLARFHKHVCVQEKSGAAPSIIQ